MEIQNFCFARRCVSYKKYEFSFRLFSRSSNFHQTRRAVKLFSSRRLHRLRLLSRATLHLSFICNSNPTNNTLMYVN